MTATLAQLKTLVAALRASSDPTVLALWQARNYAGLVEWLNGNSTTAAWMVEVSKRDLFEAMYIATYDSVTAGRKESWKLMMDLAPIDFTRQKMRKGILDIFETSDANKMLADFTEKASRAEEILGGESATSGTVTAIKRVFVGTIDLAAIQPLLMAPA